MSLALFFRSAKLLGVGCALFGFTAAGGHPAHAADQFTKGQIQFKQGGKAFTVPLQRGRLDMTPVNFGKKPAEIRNLTLLYAGEDLDKASILIANVLGAKKYGRRNIGTFWVQTGPGGLSVLKSDKGDCAFVLSRVGKDRVEGEGSCAARLDDGRGGKGLPVTEVKFSARP